MKQKYLDVLLQCRLFHNLEKDELDAMLVCMDIRIRHYGRNELANIAGDPFEGVGVMLTGQAAVVKESNAGDRMILSILKPGDLFGEMAAFSGNGKWPATIVAQMESDILYVPPDKLVGQCANACMGHRKLILNMLGILSGKALMLSRKLEYLSIRSMRARIASFLLEQYRVNGRNTFLLPMNRNELADFLNVTRPSLSREMGRMRDEGMLDYHRSSIRILDLAALKAAVQ